MKEMKKAENKANLISWAWVVLMAVPAALVTMFVDNDWVGAVVYGLGVFAGLRSERSRWQWMEAELHHLKRFIGHG